jgi:hypothetical protein
MFNFSFHFFFRWHEKSFKKFTDGLALGDRSAGGRFTMFRSTGSVPPVDVHPSIRHQM